MRVFISHCLLLLALTTVAQALFAQGKSERPNIVFILSDDHAFQAISAYGHNLNHTVNIDRLAKEGMLCTRAFVSNSLCAPSRAAILTGKYGHLNGITGNERTRFDGAQTTFPQLLQQAGYQTALIGKWHLVTDPTGFDYWNILPGQGLYYNPDFIEMGKRRRVDGYVTELTTDFSIDWLNRRDSSKPFCLLMWEKAPHRNWMPEEKYLHAFDSVDFPVPANFFDDYQHRTRAAHEQKMELARDLADNYDLKLHFSIPEPPGRLDETWAAFLSRMNPQQLEKFSSAYSGRNKAFLQNPPLGKELAVWKYQAYMRDYLRSVQSVDDNVGRLLNYLDENGLTENTIVIYSSDQGFYLGEHGWFDKRFMYEESFRTPLLVRWPARIKAGSTTDAMLMNIDIAETLLAAAGISIPDSMQGENMLPVLEGKASAKKRKAVYYHYYESGGEHNVAKHFGVRTDRYKLIYYYENKEWELFDLKKDPSEMQNVYGQPAYGNTVQQMKSELRRLQRQYADMEISW